MPVPEAPVGRSDAGSTVLALFAQMHDQIRMEIEDLDDDGLNWSPDADSNSIATIVTHLVGSEAETLRCVAGVPCTRDRRAEFVGGWRRRADVLEELRGADDLIAEVRPKIAAPRLRTTLALPTLPDDQRRSGLTWLVGNYGHAGEHVGHIQMTRQLYRAQTAGPAES
jgi:hypothetical protein